MLLTAKKKPENRGSISSYFVQMALTALMAMWWILSRVTVDKGQDFQKCRSS
jgi:hypothetical protein